MSLLENVMLGTYARTSAGLFAGAFRLNGREEASTRHEALMQLERVGLGDKPFELAGNLPLGTSASSRSRVRSPPTLRCWCWTSRPPAFAARRSCGSRSCSVAAGGPSDHPDRRA